VLETAGGRQARLAARRLRRGAAGGGGGPLLGAGEVSEDVYPADADRAAAAAQPVVSNLVGPAERVDRRRGEPQQSGDFIDGQEAHFDFVHGNAGHPWP
jgi:hypothetical protein